MTEVNKEGTDAAYNYYQYALVSDPGSALVRSDLVLIPLTTWVSKAHLKLKG